MGYIIDNARHSFFLVINSISVLAIAFSLTARPWVRLDDNTTLNLLSGQLRLFKSGTTLAQLGGFFSSDSMSVESSFLCFITNYELIWLFP